MPTKMWNILRTTWKRFLTALIARLTGPSPIEITRTSWADVIDSFAAVPDVFKSFFEPFLASGRAFPYTVRTPTFEGFLYATTEKLICTMDHETFVLERSENTFIAQCYPLEGISYVEVGTFLLDSRSKISGVTRNGVHASSTLKFNTVTDILFTPIIENIRLASVDSKDAAPSSESDKFNQWMDLDFKFMNYAKRSLMGGEKVIHAILQPEIRVRVLRVLGMTSYRRISPTLTSILTDRELIMIREKEKQFAKERYGGIWDYIPLKKIVKVSLTPRDTDVLVFSIQLPYNEHLECLFQSSAKREVDQLIDRFKELTAA